MIIDPSIVVQCTAEAEAFRLQYTSFTPKSTPRDSYSPQHSIKSEILHMNIRTTPPTLSRRLRLKRTHGGESPYGTPTDTDLENGSETSSTDGYFCSPGTPGSLSHQQSWGRRDMNSHSASSSINISSPKDSTGPNPWLSAIPRSTGLADIPMTSTWSVARRTDDIHVDDDYDGEESASVTDDKASTDAEDKASDREIGDISSTAGGVEKKAAWLLMKLSVKDGESCSEAVRDVARKERDLVDGPRIKRRRATSM
jgi:hypothetical protein